MVREVEKVVEEKEVAREGRWGRQWWWRGWWWQGGGDGGGEGGGPVEVMVAGTVVGMAEAKEVASAVEKVAAARAAAGRR